jgi:16S rRNA (guanine527-N7)-methyltransferase
MDNRDAHTSRENHAGGLIEEGLLQLGMPADPRTLEALVRYTSAIDRWNRRINLVKAEGTTLVKRHILDSLAALSVIADIKDRETIADLGSGAGLPGIPLSLFMPDSRFTLIERSEKKAVFLQNVVMEMNLTNVEVLPRNLREVPKSFSIVVFRALVRLSNPLLREILRITRPGGTIVAFKGKRSRIEGELQIAARAGWLHRAGIESHKIVPLAVPFLEEERHLVLFEKPFDKGT